MAGAVQVSNELVKLFGPPPHWAVKCYGNTIIGGPQDRPIIWRNGKIQYASLAYPLYGVNEGYDFVNEAKLEVNAEDIGEPDALMTGVIEVREAWHREHTGERGWVGKPTTIDLGSTPSKIKVSSNSWGYYDRNITHRVFYVNFVDMLGTYYEAAKIEYTTEQANNTDSVVINVSPEEIVFNRPLEEMQETLMFPAVKTAVFWKGRIWGGNLEPRSFAPGTKLTILNGSNRVIIEPTSPGGTTYPDYFRPADVYRGIVDKTTGTIVAFIRRVVHSLMVEVQFPNNPDEDATWPHPTFTSDQVTLSGNMSDIYSTPIYAGGAGGAIIQGIMTWCPLDVLHDENFYASGAELIKLTTAGDELCAIYDRGIGFYSGEVNAGRPNCRAFIAAKNVGSFNPENVWQAKDGSVWFEGGGRLYVIKSGQVVEASKSMGVASFWERWVHPYGEGLRRYQAGYNPQRNMALLVNLPKLDETTADYGTYGVAVCHDSMTVNPVRFRDKYSAIHCIQHDNGDWQFYGGTKDGRIDKLLVRGVKDDDGAPVAWKYTTGVLWVDGTVYTVGVRFLLESDATDGINIQVAVDMKSGNINSGKFSADSDRAVAHAELSRLEYVPLHRLAGYGVQYEVSGETAREFKLVGMTAIEDLQPARIGS